ncbi:MAG: 30S ribosomal protein S6 [Planctomycetes bacterium]|nr:30S ribosomal protein S6 [Planctomycetota bacterium]
MTERLYEGMFLFDANQTARRWSELESRVGTILSKNGAELRYAERWPDQRLAYEIQGARKGTYYLTYFTAPPQSIQQIRRDSELTEDILRVLVLHEEGLDAEMERRRVMTEARKREEASRPAPAETSDDDDSSEDDTRDDSRDDYDDDSDRDDSDDDRYSDE